MALESSSDLIGWRVCAGFPREKSGSWLVRPLFPSDGRYLIYKGGVIPKAEVHVGTSEQFCLDYYAGRVELEPGESELLLRLDCTDRLVDEAEAEKWAWPCATEAKARMPRVLGIEVIATKNGQHE